MKKLILIVFFILIIAFTGCVNNNSSPEKTSANVHTPSLVLPSSTEFNTLFEMYNKLTNIENGKRGRVDLLRTKIEEYIAYIDNPDAKKILPTNIDTVSELKKVDELFTKYKEYKQNGDEVHAKEQLSLIHDRYYVKKTINNNVRDTMIITDEFQNKVAQAAGGGWDCNEYNAIEGVPVQLVYTEEVYDVYGAGFTFTVKQIYLNMYPYVTYSDIKARGCREERISSIIQDIRDEIVKTYTPKYIIYK